MPWCNIINWKPGYIAPCLTCLKQDSITYSDIEPSYLIQKNLNKLARVCNVLAVLKLGGSTMFYFQINKFYCLRQQPTPIQSLDRNSGWLRVHTPTPPNAIHLHVRWPCSQILAPPQPIQQYVLRPWSHIQQLFTNKYNIASLSHAHT